MKKAISKDDGLDGVRQALRKTRRGDRRHTAQAVRNLATMLEIQQQAIRNRAQELKRIADTLPTNETFTDPILVREWFKITKNGVNNEAFALEAQALAIAQVLNDFNNGMLEK